MPKFSVQKLIRDKMPSYMQEKGVMPTLSIIEDDNFYKECLFIKLEEEIDEFKKATCIAEKQEEMADILEVLKALSTIDQLSWNAIEQTREGKHKERGGFDQRFFSLFVEIQTDNPNIDYYLKKKDIYPIIENDSTIINTTS